MADTEIPQHFAVPFTSAAGAITTVDEDSTEEITDCVVNLLRTETGWLEWLPGYGRPDEAFTLGDIDIAPIHDLVLQWEPRATVEITRLALNQLQVTEVTANG